MASLTYRSWRTGSNASALIADYPPEPPSIGSDENSVPEWAPRTKSALRDALRLPPGWNNRGAKPVTVDALRSVIGALNATMSHDSPAPDVVPLATGGLQLEWHLHQIDIELTASRRGELSVYVRDRQTGREAEGDTRVDLRLADAIDCLTRRQRQRL